MISDFYEWAFPSYIPTPPPRTAAAPPSQSDMWKALQAQAAMYLYPPLPGPYVGTPTPLETTWSNEKIVAYRTVTAVEDDGMWLGHYHPDGPSLTTAGHGGGEMMTAQCPDGCESAPSLSCKSSHGDGCGWYAYKTKERAEQATRYDPPIFPPLTVARVLLWGTVIEYTEGYRAQYLAIDEIYKVPAPESVRGSADFGPGSIISTKIAAINATINATMFGTGVISKDLFAARQGKTAAMASVCDEPCSGCIQDCARHDLKHSAHLCKTGLDGALRAGLKLK